MRLKTRYQLRPNLTDISSVTLAHLEYFWISFEASTANRGIHTDTAGCQLTWVTSTSSLITPLSFLSDALPAATHTMHSGLAQASSYAALHTGGLLAYSVAGKAETIRAKFPPSPYHSRTMTTTKSKLIRTSWSSSPAASRKAAAMTPALSKSGVFDVIMLTRTFASWTSVMQ